MATIVEAIKTVLVQYPDGLTSSEIYDKIIDNNLYAFNAINPQGIVSGMIRRHCYGLDFSTASPNKYFSIVSNARGKARYALYDEELSMYELSSIDSSEEKLPEENSR